MVVRSVPYPSAAPKISRSLTRKSTPLATPAVENRFVVVSPLFAAEPNWSVPPVQNAIAGGDERLHVRVLGWIESRGVERIDPAADIAVRVARLNGEGEHGDDRRRAGYRAGVCVEREARRQCAGNNRECVRRGAAAGADRLI